MRKSGILLPIFSLASRYGIGCLSREAYSFIDFLNESGQGYWQILPVGPTGYGNSPYQPFSAFAGNPYFISLESLIEEGLLYLDECSNTFWGSNEEQVDYGALYENRQKVLMSAYDRFKEKNGEMSENYKSFVSSESYWLEDYCLYRTIKMLNNGAGWETWPDALKKRDKKALDSVRKESADLIGLFRFQQYEFDCQWKKLKEYAALKGVKIIGDIPFYVSMDSSDVWAHPECFLIDKDMVPEMIAGCPPDAFSREGQLWGNPVYDWKALKKSGYDWWIKRIERSYNLFDVVRIDHFHGFSEYYAVPYGAKNAVNGEKCKGPGMDFFDSLKKVTGEYITEEGSRIIAEDLGNVTEENKDFLEKSQIPGMKILQYAFTSWDSIYLPYKHDRKCVVYTGTHDNMTARTFLDCINDGERNYLRKYLNSLNSDYGALTWDFIRECYRSVADLCIIPIQDYLVKGNEARINTPGKSDGNWQWRLKPNFLSHDLAGSIRNLAETYGRI